MKYCLAYIYCSQKVGGIRFLPGPSATVFVNAYICGISISLYVMCVFLIVENLIFYARMATQVNFECK